MSNLSDLLPAGASAKSIEAVASGTLAAGEPVILTAAGKAAPITSVTGSVGTPVVFESAQTDGTISTSSSDAVKLGRALSATSIDLEYQS